MTTFDSVTPASAAGVNVTFRRGRPDDAAACGEICFRAFASVNDRYGFPRDFAVPEMTTGMLAHVLALPFVDSVVAERDG